MIAISFRREDSLPVAGRLYDRLQAKFGKKNVFMDFDSIPTGADFREQIKRMIERSRLVIAIIGPHWLGEQPDLSVRIVFDGRLPSDLKSATSVCKNLCKNESISARTLKQSKIREFGQFTQVNRARFDRLRKAVKSLKPQF